MTFAIKGVFLGGRLIRHRSGSEPQDVDLVSRLRKLPGVVSVRLSDGKESEAGSYELKFEQPVDWKRPRGPRFRQRAILRHARPDASVILLTEGYSASTGGQSRELRAMLGVPTS